MFVLGHNQPDMVKLLLSIDVAEFESDPHSLKEKRGNHRSAADVDAYWNKNTVLHLAAIYNLPEVTGILCQEEGINLNIRNGKVATALFDSAVVVSKEVARVLVDRDDIDLRLMGLHLHLDRNGASE